MKGGYIDRDRAHANDEAVTLHEQRAAGTESSREILKPKFFQKRDPMPFTPGLSYICPHTSSHLLTFPTDTITTFILFASVVSCTSVVAPPGSPSGMYTFLTLTPHTHHHYLHTLCEVDGLHLGCGIPGVPLRHAYFPHTFLHTRYLYTLCVDGLVHFSRGSAGVPLRHTQLPAGRPAPRLAVGVGGNVRTCTLGRRRGCTECGGGWGGGAQKV